jgi:hypothetical protein
MSLQITTIFIQKANKKTNITLFLFLFQKDKNIHIISKKNKTKKRKQTFGQMGSGYGVWQNVRLSLSMAHPTRYDRMAFL